MPDCARPASIRCDDEIITNRGAAISEPTLDEPWVQRERRIKRFVVASLSGRRPVNPDVTRLKIHGATYPQLHDQGDHCRWRPIGNGAAMDYVSACHASPVRRPPSLRRLERSLRRNTRGGFGIVSVADPSHPRLCPICPNRYTHLPLWPKRLAILE